jgi:hypothetical protein
MIRRLAQMPFRFARALGRWRWAFWCLVGMHEWRHARFGRRCLRCRKMVFYEEKP